jgi:ParB-like chromosome segregation protein Spo0J
VSVAMKAGKADNRRSARGGQTPSATSHNLCHEGTGGMSETDSIVEVAPYDVAAQIQLLTMPVADQLVEDATALFSCLQGLDLQDRVETINRIREALREHSPFKAEPVDCVRWVKAEQVTANDYNPNSVAPPEMQLLAHSITEDGYTQPIVSWLREDNIREVVDGFHRHRVGREVPAVRERVHGYLPVVTINNERQDKGDRMAATIRHNRARGEHRVDSMADIVVELKRRFWSDAKIATELGMDPDEVLRLQQVTGLAGLFADRSFSEAWQATSFDEVEGTNADEDD